MKIESNLFSNQNFYQYSVAVHLQGIENLKRFEQIAGKKWRKFHCFKFYYMILFKTILSFVYFNEFIKKTFGNPNPFCR